LNNSHPLLPDKLVSNEAEPCPNLTDLTSLSFFHAFQFENRGLPKLVIHATVALQFLHDSAIEVVKELLGLGELPLFNLHKGIPQDTRLLFDVLE
jgi:hypothetical protein